MYGTTLWAHTGEHGPADWRRQLLLPFRDNGVECPHGQTTALPDDTSAEATISTSRGQPHLGASIIAAHTGDMDTMRDSA
ncbi:MAG: hypothetical protein ACR2G2_15765 [Pseudonocardia sp.]